MGVTPEPQASPRYRRLLTASGIRATPQRLLVLETLAGEPNDATAQQIHARLRDGGHRVGLATIYRTLSALSEHGLVDALMHHPGEACYRLCAAGHHHHLVCTNCHRVVELGDCELDPWLAQLGSEHGFTITAHAVEVAGVCGDCAGSA
jgi:Fur family transcriptional regulator, ferric uptake regulator